MDGARKTLAPEEGGGAGIDRAAKTRGPGARSQRGRTAQGICATAWLQNRREVWKVRLYVRFVGMMVTR